MNIENFGGAVYIGNGSQTTGIAVGSRFGPTNVAAHDANVLASTTTEAAFAQLGFRTDHNAQGYLIDGPITVHLTGNLVATAGTENAYAQVGHGGGFVATSSLARLSDSNVPASVHHPSRMS